MRYTLLLLFTILMSSTLFAQPPWGSGRGKKGPTIKGKITGVALDSSTGAPIEFATYVLSKLADSTQVSGGLTEADGSFKIIEVDNGDYLLQFSFLGYEDKTVVINSTLEKPDVDLGEISLTSIGLNLEEVVVEAEAALIENRVDKLVYNAEKDASTSGGDASDVLRNVPLLSVDLEGNVSLRGSSNILILINGRPSTMFGASPADAFKTIPADQIKSVEVITTPTAKYDGEGSAGIINIITKKKNAEGFTGSVNTSIGNRQNNGGLNLNWLRGRFGLNGGANSFWSWRREGSLDFFRQEDSVDGAAPTVFQQGGPNASQVLGFNGNFGAYYDFNAYNSLNSTIRFNGFNSWRDGTIDGSLGALGADPLVTFQRLNDNQNFRNGFDWTTDFKRTFPNSEREFSVALQLSDTNSEQENITDQDGTTEEYQEDIRNFNDGLNREYTVQADYVHPFGDKIKMETGAKTVIRRIDSDYTTLTRLGNDVFQPIASQTDNFAYEQDVYAAYLSFTVKLGERNSLVAGARYEHTSIGGDYQENPVAPFTQEYDNILPSIILSHQFPNFSNLKLSYTQRIQRPSLFFINPFTQVGDPNNVTVGNPELDPEIVDQVELSYGAFVKGTSLNVSVFYRRTTDIIEGFVTVDPLSNISETNFLNIGENNSIGVNLFTSKNFKKIGTFRIGFNLFTYDAESTVEGINLSRTALIWSGNAGANINLPKDWKFDFFGFARSPRQTLQGSNPSFWLYGMGIRKDFNKRFSLGVRAIEPFNETKNFPSEIQGDDFFQTSDFRIPFRSIGISLRYNFGQLDFKGNRRGRGTKIKNDDQKDGGGGSY